MTCFSVSRQGMAASVAVILTMLALAASAGAAPLLVTGNYDSDSVSVIESHTVLGEPIELPTKPGAIAITPAGRAFVAEPGTNSVAVIDPKARKLLKTIPVGKGPEYLAVSPDRKTVYVADPGSDELTLIDTESEEKTGSIPLSFSPYGIALTPDGKFAILTEDGGDHVYFLELAQRKILPEPIEVGTGPTPGLVNLAVTPDGATAYAVDQESNEVTVINTATHQVSGKFEFPGLAPFGVAVSRDGTELYVGEVGEAPAYEGTVSVFSTQTKLPIHKPIPVGRGTSEIALSPDGKTLYTADHLSSTVTPISTATKTAGPPIELPGAGPWQVAVTPFQSPTAAFSAPTVTTGQPATFSGAASTDPDGTIASWSWTFGDGGTATGVSPVHTYASSGTYDAELSVVDSNGCGKEPIFTGRTAYCGGNPLAKVVHPVEAKVAPTTVCTARFLVQRIVHDRKNGTVRMGLKLPAAGSLFLFGKKVHAITRKVRQKGSTMLTIHARVEVNKRLKKIHRQPVKVRVTFTPTAGCGFSTVHRSFALLRAPRKKHRG